MKDVAHAIRRARDEPTTENLEAMWRHVFALPAWYLLPANPDGPSTPLVARLGDGDWIAAFTHLRALRDFASSAGLVTDGELAMLTLTPNDALQRIDEAADHVAGVAFNLGTDLGFRAPMQALREFRERF